VLEPTAAEARPRPVMAVVRQGLRLWADNALALWGVIVPVTVLAELVVVLATVATAPAGSTVLNGTIYVLPGSSTATIVTVRLLGDAVGALVGVLCAGVALRIFSEAAFGRAVPAREALRFGRQRFGALLWLGILSGLITAAGIFALILPGIYLIVAFAVAAPVLVIEGHRGIVALQRSRELIKGRWWPTLGALLPTMVLVGAGALVVETTLRTSGGVSGFALTQAVGVVVLQALLVPLATATSVAIYFDLRARRGPGRIEAAAPQAGSPAPPTAPAAAGDIWWS
jgi:hypothetical protein